MVDGFMDLSISFLACRVLLGGLLLFRWLVCLFVFVSAYLRPLFALISPSFLCVYICISFSLVIGGWAGFLRSPRTPAVYDISPVPVWYDVVGAACGCVCIYVALTRCVRAVALPRVMDGSF